MTNKRSGMQAARCAGLAVMALLLFSGVMFAQGGRYQSDDAWAFGVTADTQWVITYSIELDPEDPYYAHVNPNYREENPDYVSVSTLLEMNKQFIAHDVRFVIQLGDLTDRAGNAAMFTHAEARQPLHDAGIGFFPLRGNHETYGELYGLDPDRDINIPAWREAFPQTRGLGPNLFGTENFSRPANDRLEGLSYSFDYGTSGNDARFVFVDTESTHYTETRPASHAVYGDGAFFSYWAWTVYKHTEPLVAREGNIIEPGEYFRITGGQPSTLFYVDEIATDENLFYVRYTATGDSNPGPQQSWISAQLDLQNSERPAHAFVMSHRNLMGQNHVDIMFGSGPGSKAADQNAFFRSMQENGVRYFLSAHDHMHNRSIVQSPNRSYFIEQLIAASSDPKFYNPVSLDRFIVGVVNHKDRETQVSQELDNIGYYIFTVDGPRLRVDYYADAAGNFGNTYCWPDGWAGDGSCGSRPDSSSRPEQMGSLYVPDFNFIKKETWGYSLNGKQFLFPQGVSYAGIYENGEEIIPGVKDAFNGTTAAILAGFNGSTATDFTPYAENAAGATISAPRALTKAVGTGWVAKPAGNNELLSDIFSLWGMTDLGATATDVYVLEMSYADPRVMGKGNQQGNAGIRLSSLDAKGNWVNAVTLNVGVKNARDQKFIQGPWKSEYPLGYYGIDMENGTVWAVINYEADFAVTGVGQAPGGPAAKR
jgi:hypothetical protein